MFGKKKTRETPSYVVAVDGSRPSAATPILDRPTETWVASWPTQFGIISADGESNFYEWSEFATGAWDETSDTLSLTFVDPRTDSIQLHLTDDASSTLITMVRERIDRSIVYQQFETLPSGGIARGQVRRNADESLFTEIMVDREPAEYDIPTLNRLENDLREAVGLPVL